MARVVSVVHPALAQFVPRGGRKLQSAVVSTTTQATLTEADPESFRWLKTLSYSVPLMEHAGRLWMPIRARGGYASPDALAAFLAEPSGERARSEFSPLLGTPLLALAKDGSGWSGLPEANLQDARQASIGAEAAVRVQTFLDERVRLAGDRAYVRADILVCANWQARNYYRYCEPFGMDAQGLLAHPAQAKAMWDHFLDGVGGRAPDLQNAVRRFKRENQDIPFDLVPANAHEAPMLSYLARLLEEALREKPPTRSIPARCQRTLAALHDDNHALWFDAVTGQVGAERIPDLLSLHQAYKENVGVGWRRDYAGTLHKVAAYVREVVAPSIQADAPDPDDIAALEGLPAPR